MIPETFRARAVSAMGGYFCSNSRADEWQQFIEGHADKLAGYERSLAQATESVRLCAGLRDAKGEELIAAFGSYNQG